MAYQKRTKEEALHDCTDIKKHWIKNLFNNMKKLTGRTGEDGDRINWCMAIEKKIMRKTHSGMLGFTLDEGSVNLETENTRRRGSERGLRKLTFNVEYDDEGNPIADPAPVNIPPIPPLRHSPRCSPQQRPHADNNNEVRQQETNVNAKGVTTTPAMDAAHAALRKAESTIKAQKTKNSSNKHKERTSIGGAIVKLIEQGQGSSRGMGTTMNMTLARQMECINKSMDNQDKREAKERKKEHKHRRKQQAKKKAKKARKRAALERLEDHGGKAGSGDSSSSSSSSSSSTNSEDSESSSSDSDQSSNYGCGSWRRGGGIVVEKKTNCSC
jgi:hypothetical protein